MCMCARTLQTRREAKCSAVGRASRLASMLSLLVLSCRSTASPGAERSRLDAAYDAVILNGRVIDGSGNPWFYGSVGLKNGHIVKIGRIDPKSAKRVIDATGMVV